MPRSRPLAPEKLGEKGESRFQELCTDGNLIANKAAIDAMGWDYLVECPYPKPDALMPLDKRPHPIECKVQVKTVWDGTNVVALKLSAAERLAKADRPAFIVVLSVDMELNVVSMHVFHMLDQHLEQVLKRLRRATAEGSLKINHLQLTFNVRDGVAVDLDGQSLRRFIVCACGDDVTAYYKKKQDQLSNLGFGKLRIEGKFTVKTKSESEISELFLGMRSAEVVLFEASEIRFGIKIPSHAERGGRVSIIPQALEKCRIIATGFNDGSCVTLLGQLYLSPQRNRNGDLPFRIATPLMQFFVNGTEFTIDNKTIEFFKRSVLIKEILATLKFHSLIAGGGCRLTVVARDQQIFGVTLETPVDQEVFEATNQRIRLTEMMAATLRAAGGQSRPVSISSMADNANALLFLSELIEDGSSVSVDSMSFRPEGDFQMPSISEGLLVQRLHFQEFYICYYAVMDITLNHCPPDVVMNVSSISLRDIQVIDGDDEAFRAYADEARLTTGIALSLVMDAF